MSDIIVVVRDESAIRLSIDDPQTQIVTINQGQPGPAGAAGATGPQGPTGPAGAAGPPIVNTGSYSVPSVISGAITVPSDQRARIFLKGSGALVAVTSIGNGTGTQELYLYGCDNAARIQLNNLANVKINGEFQSAIDAELCLHWIDGASKWVEAYRNGI